MIIDFHTHTLPESLATDAINQLAEASSMQPFGNGTESGLLNELQAGPVTHAVSLPVATRPDQVESINEYSIKRPDGPILFLGAMHPQYPDFESELERLHKAGIQGIKLHPEFQSFYPDDLQLYPLYETVIKLGMFILFHSGEEEFLHHSPAHAHPIRFARLHDNLPDLQMILAHFGSHRLHQEVINHIVGKNIFIDCSYSLSHIPRETALQIISAHDPTYLIYGSDWPWQPLQGYYDRFLSLNLGNSVNNMICTENPKRLLSL